MQIPGRNWDIKIEDGTGMPHDIAFHTLKGIDAGKTNDNVPYGE